MTVDSKLKKAQEAIAFRDRLFSLQQNFRTLWQSVSDMMFPQTYGITTRHAVGHELMTNLFDTTAVEEVENMTSGIATNLFPAGQRFFRYDAPPGLQDDQEVSDYNYYLTEQLHEHVFNSNYVAQTSNTIQYWLCFGTGANYSDWTVQDGLNYRDYAIGTYQCAENSKGIIDTIVLTCKMTARQIQQDFGTDLGDSVRQALGPESSRSNEEFPIIHIVRPRKDRNPDLDDALNMPYESVFINERDQHVLQEGGFEEFPFAIPRYTVLYREVYGRGRGTMLLPQVRILNRLAKDYLEMSNKWVNPPKQVLDTFEGQVDVSPGALNYVTQIDSVRPIDMGSNGMYPITKDILEYFRNNIKEGFYHNAFSPITPLSGDRRNTTEIIERLKEGMKQLAKPLGRLFIELLTPQLTRSAMLLIRNRVIEQPPDVLQGRVMNLRFINPLALALEDQQARGGQHWISIVGEAEQIFPGIKDNVVSDQWARDLGQSLGVSSKHIKPVDERDEERALQIQQRAQQEQIEAAQMASDAYSKTTKAPEDGSAAAEQMGA
ncbi:MAG: hypothetical protein GY941_21680 [Planctomycetes bacterium]|nr:hypothetical protein [Planctomycetota bacterium]